MKTILTAIAVIAAAQMSYGACSPAGCGTAPPKASSSAGAEAACPTGGCPIASGERDECPDGACPVTGKARSAAACATGACPVTGKQAAAEAPAPAREAGDEKHATVTTDAVRAIISAGIPVSILDARTGRYDDGRRLPKAKALSAEASAREAARHIPSKNSLVITYCSNTQCPASAHLAKRLRDLGYTNVIEYPAGIAGWEKAGHEIHTVN